MSAEMTFELKLRVPPDILYGVNENENDVSTMANLKKKPTTMYELAGECRKARQAKYVNYHDRKVSDDALEREILVYMYRPRKSREMKWRGTGKVKSPKHPVYGNSVSTKTVRM